MRFKDALGQFLLEPDFAGSQPMRTAVHITWTWSPNKLWRSNSIFTVTYGFKDALGQFYWSQTLRGLSQWEQLYTSREHGAQINFGDLTPYLIGKFVILRYDKILFTENARNCRRENLAKLHVKNLPNLLLLRNPPNRRGSVEKQQAWVYVLHHVTWSSNKLWRSNSLIFNPLGFKDALGQFYWSQTLTFQGTAAWISWEAST